MTNTHQDAGVDSNGWGYNSSLIQAITSTLDYLIINPACLEQLTLTLNIIQRKDRTAYLLVL